MVARHLHQWQFFNNQCKSKSTLLKIGDPDGAWDGERAVASKRGSIGICPRSLAHSTVDTFEIGGGRIFTRFATRPHLPNCKPVNM